MDAAILASISTASTEYIPIADSQEIITQSVSLGKRADAKINARQVQALARAQFTPDQGLTLLCILCLFDEKHMKKEKYPFQPVLKPPPAIFIKAYAPFMTNVNALIVLIVNRDAVY